MSGNLENDRSITASKMYPIDLAQKITIVKSVSNTEVKMAHLIPGQPKTTSAGQIITHAGPVSMMRPATILSPSVSSQPQMIVSGSPLLQGTQIVSQSSQLIGPNSQIISQSQIISPSGQILSPGTQIISQGTQLSAQVSNSNTGSNSVQVTVPSSVSGQVLSVGGLVSSTQGLVGGAGNLVVSSSVRTLPPSVRVLPPLTHHPNRPAVHVNVSSSGGVLMSKSVSSHVPRGLAAGASLAVRPVTPTVNASAASAAGSGPWSSSARGRGALVYGSRGPGAPLPRSAAPRAAPQPAPPPAPSSAVAVATPPSHAAIVTLSTTTVLPSSSIISGSLRGVAPSPRALTPTPAPVVAPRPLPLLQRNYQPAKVVGVASVGVRGVVGNSAPTQLYYEVPRAAQPHPQHTQPHTPQHTQPHTPQHTQPHTPHHGQPHAPQHVQTHTPQHLQQLSQPHTPQHGQLHTSQHVQQHTQTHVSLGQPHTPQHGQPHSQPHALPHAQPHAMQHVAQSLAALPRPLTPYGHTQQVQVSVVTALQPAPAPAPAAAAPALPRPTILRKREPDGSPSKTGVGTYGAGGWEDVPAGGGGGGSGGSTTISAASSPAPPEPDAPPPEDIASPRKKPRKQMLTNELRQCQEFPTEEAPPTPPPAAIPPKRPQLSAAYVCGWRGTALHFTRPADVRRREPRDKDILAIANQKHALTSADGWKVHHLTAQMDDLVMLETDVGNQLNGILKTVEGAGGKALTALQPHTHNLLELIKGNIQRSKIVCEGIQESREDILRVFTHRNFVSDILTRQADKRCFRKHRSQS